MTITGIGQIYHPIRVFFFRTFESFNLFEIKYLLFGTFFKYSYVYFYLYRINMFVNVGMVSFDYADQQELVLKEELPPT